MHNKAVVQRSCFVVLLRYFLSRRRTENVRSEVADFTGNVKYKPLLSSLLKNPTVDWLLEHRPELFKKSPTTYYFVKRDSDETICEKIMRLNILPNQFYAALAIFSAPKRGGLSPPALAPLLRNCTQSCPCVEQGAKKDQPILFRALV